MSHGHISPLHNAGKAKLDCLEFILNFERFIKSKTVTNVSDWMLKSCVEAKIVSSNFSQLSADGASNAIGSVQEFEVLTRPGRHNEVDFNVCAVHQNERSGGMASGTINIEGANYDLGAELKKNHEIQVRLHQSGNRMNVFQDVQKRKGRDPSLCPDPGNDVRWNSSVEEAARSNMIMGDVEDAQNVLLASDGDDYDLLANEEKESGDTSHLTQTPHNKKILRQFEGAATPAKTFSKFLQDGEHSPPYVLIEARLAIQSASADYFSIVSGTVFIVCYVNAMFYCVHCCIVNLTSALFALTSASFARRFSCG